MINNTQMTRGTRNKKTKKKTYKKSRDRLTRSVGKQMRDYKKVRSFFVVCFVCFVFMIVFVRLYGLQVRAHEDYKELAINQHQVVRDLTPERGEVFLNNGDEMYPLAINREYMMAYFSPRDVEDVDATVNRLAEILSLAHDDIRAKLADRKDVFEILKHRLTESERAAIEAADMKGVALLPESFRYYPGGELAAQTIGFVGSDGQKYSGQYGIERKFEERLKGTPGSLQQERDARGTWLSIADRLLTPAQDGVDVVLTMDYTVQFEVERILRETVQKHDADAGSIVVMEPKTGRIVALANYPTFNPNDYHKVQDTAAFVNTAVSQPYEVGSVFKPLTMAMGLDKKVVTPDSTYIDTGAISAGGFTIQNSEEKVYGLSTMTEVLEESMNTGVIHVEELVGNKAFAQYMADFDIGEPSGIDLPLDVPGNIDNLSDLRRRVEFYTASFGQGITITPLQLASTYSALANGGMLMKPQIISKKIYPDGHEEHVYPEEIRRVIAEDASHDISTMLRSVVVSGHGKRADVPGYSVGGKTGTAQVAKSDAKGYDDLLTIGTFAGYAPTHDPRFTIVVKIENPKDVIWAESSAAPAFGKVMKYLLDFYNVEPTEEIHSTVVKK